MVSHWLSGFRRFRLRTLMLLVLTAAFLLGGSVWCGRALRRRENYLKWSRYCEVQRDHFESLQHGDAIDPFLIDMYPESLSNLNLNKLESRVMFSRQLSSQRRRAAQLVDYFDAKRRRFAIAAYLPWVEVRFDPLPPDLEVAAR